MKERSFGSDLRKSLYCKTMALISDFTNTILHILKSIAFAIKAHYPCSVHARHRAITNQSRDFAAKKRI